MQGHIGNRKGSQGISWHYVMYTGRDPRTGKKTQKWKRGFRTKKSAVRALREAIDRFEKFGGEGRDDIQLSEVIDMWDRDHVSNLAQSTAVGYRRNVKRYIGPAFGHYLINEPKPIALQAWASSLMTPEQDEKKLSAKTVRGILDVLSGIYTYAVGLELAHRNPVRLVRRPAVQPYDWFVLTPSMVLELLAAAKSKDIHTPIAFALHTGVRRGETAGAKWNRLDFKSKTFTVALARIRVSSGDIETKRPKTPASRRTITLDDTILAIMADYKAVQQEHFKKLGKRWTDNGFIFVDDSGDTHPPDFFSDKFREVADLVGFHRARFHDLRHAHASILINRGVSAKAVQTRLGHSSIQMTLDTYAHLFPDTEVSASREFEGALLGD